jgi:hypothetical protein
MASLTSLFAAVPNFSIAMKTAICIWLACTKQHACRWSVWLTKAFGTRNACATWISGLSTCWKHGTWLYAQGSSSWWLGAISLHPWTLCMVQGGGIAWSLPTCNLTFACDVVFVWEYLPVFLFALVTFALCLVCTRPVLLSVSSASQYLVL